VLNLLTSILFSDRIGLKGAGIYLASNYAISIPEFLIQG
jgi:hypothetical protein